jgi:hypothetical protein
MFLIFTCANIVYLVGNIFSEMLLLQIFWSLGTKVNVEVSPEQEPLQSEEEIHRTTQAPEQADYDEDAELNAAMWN